MFYFSYVYIYVFTNPSVRAGYDTRSIFLRSLTGLLFLDLLYHQGWRTSLPYYLPMAGGRITRFIPFPRALQSVSSRICTRVAVSISYDDNHYTTCTSYLYIYALNSTEVLSLLEDLCITREEIGNSSYAPPPRKTRCINYTALTRIPHKLDHPAHHSAHNSK